MSSNQFQQRALSQCKTEKTLGSNTPSNRELKEQKQINQENVIELELESKKEENVNLYQCQNQPFQNDKQKKKTILQKDLRSKQRIKNPQELNHQHQICGAEEELQVVQETSQKMIQKTFKVKTEKISFQYNIQQKIQEMENQLKVQQQEIGILKQNKFKEILPISNEELIIEDLQNDKFQLTQFIQLQIHELNRNNYKKIESQIQQILNSFSLEQKSNEKNLEQIKQQVIFDSENIQNKIIDFISRDLNLLKIKIEQVDQSFIQLTTKFNQTIQIQETFQKDLTKLQQFKREKSQQPKIQEEQMSQIIQEQLNQLSCQMDEKVRNIKIYIDHHLENIQNTIILNKMNEKSEILKIKDELLQEQKKNFDKALNHLTTENLKINQQPKQLQVETLYQEEHIQKQQIQGNICQHKYLQNNFVEITDNIKMNEIENKKNIKILSIDDKIKVEFDSSRSQSIKTHLNLLYNESSRKRDTEKEFQYYLRKIQSEKELFQYYNIQNFQAQKELRNHCSQFRQVRGDGNCFYSAFGFQYLELLIRFSDHEFDTEKNLFSYSKIISKITYQNFYTDKIPNFSDYLIFEFIYRIKKLRQISNLAERQLQLEKQFAAHSEETEEIDGCFYGLVIIFFRNLSNYLFENSDMFLVITENNNILIWEQEFNSTELIISELAKFLQIHVMLIFFEKNIFKVQEYQPTNQDKIILLIRPGHYNIGIS